MSRQIVINLDGKPHIYQEAVRFNTEIWIDKKDGTIEKMCCRDLGPVNEDGCLAEERTGKFPIIAELKEEGVWIVRLHAGNVTITVTGATRQQAIDAWNRRAR